MGQILGIGAALLGFLVAAVLLFRLVAGDLAGGAGGSGRGASAASELHVPTYIDNSRSLGGNVYRLRGTIEETLKWTPDRGRLVSVEAGSGGGSDLLPMLIPETFAHINIDRGATFDFVVRVDRDGLLIAERIDQ